MGGSTDAKSKPRPPRPPAMRQHKRGQYFCRWGGKDHYFGTDFEAAQTAYHASLREWGLWQQKKQARRARPPASELRFVQLVELFYAARLPDVSDDQVKWYKNHLRRPLNLWGRFPASAVTSKHLQAYVQDMRRIKENAKAKFSPKTIRHDLSAVKAVLRWGMDLDHIPEIRLDGVKPPRATPPKEKAWTLDYIKGLIAIAEKNDPRLVPWLAVNYLAACRPSELPRLAARDGEFETPHVFKITGKMSWKTGELRHVILSDEALIYFNTLKPYWSYWRSYSKRAAAICKMKGGVHPLRHSAAKHLRLAGVDRETRSLILGHTQPLLSRTYDPSASTSPVESAAKLTLR